ncbi:MULTISPECIES: hypothetical protein [unclassified Mesorhizobium]|uniref:hypothetical protein n=1 Tax=unclassified Mesorhizobium TaxID=325217 RepID=UPI000FC9F7D8|nr:MULTISPECIES: hypothetical protein [unclassified Mesorhizobium]TIT79966.1 MAG: hypothetical protein E5W57_04810 [Mesorhizobium sp.]TGP23994.1 hypothetical protein EN874_009800 [Mesorhizobium sp. M1D.F.Ca.ET.231.01.1.1]TGP35419.1 hypothetical protein EN877_12295 [Mesorhizobium sp. M1D.F.Ca.ET.234.01.1.1]TGS49442.1 hypothetical protein EN827_12290 [Mesorhizobium sp. M1D.F.Ca.ET.184.01.1.1]TGS63638.1 hypothetical protein EN826_012290 [Mesorhizobium sp. M1D.F.Ca.ET.183.01.1.1]
MPFRPVTSNVRIRVTSCHFAALVPMGSKSESVLEPRSHVTSHLLQVGFQQVDGAIGLAEQFTSTRRSISWWATRPKKAPAMMAEQSELYPDVPGLEPDARYSERSASTLLNA